MTETVYTRDTVRLRVTIERTLDSLWAYKWTVKPVDGSWPDSVPRGPYGNVRDNGEAWTKLSARWGARDFCSRVARVILEGKVVETWAYEADPK